MRQALVAGAVAVGVMVLARLREQQSSWWTLLFGLAVAVAGCAAMAAGIWLVGLPLLGWYFMVMKRWADRVEHEL